MNSVDAIFRLWDFETTRHTFGTRGLSFPNRTVSGPTINFWLRIAPPRSCTGELDT